MEQNITSERFRYWVTEVELEARPDRPGDDSLFMYGCPFADDRDDLEWDAPAGKVLVIGPEGRAILDLHLSPAHVAGRGDVVSVKGWTSLMTPPFLLTNLLEAEIIAQRRVGIVPTADARQVFERDGEDGEYPVEADDWFGVLPEIVPISWLLGPRRERK